MHKLMAVAASATRNRPQHAAGFVAEAARPRASTGPSASGSARPSPTVSRRDKAAKPIIDWIARKLGATKRPVVENEASPALAIARPAVPAARREVGPSSSPHPVGRGSRRSSSPQAAYSFATNSASRAESHSLRSLEGSPSHRSPYLSHLYSLDTGEDTHSSYTSRSHSTHSHNSLASYSARTRDDGSFFSGYRAADEDASLRPIVPSRPGSMAASYMPAEVVSSDAAAESSARRSSSYKAPESRRFSETSSVVSSESPSRAGVSGASSASTKPTTLMSVDMRPRAAHIAQAPPAIDVPPVRRSSNLSRPSSRVSAPSTPAPTSHPGSFHAGTPPDIPRARHSFLSAESSVPPPITDATRTQAPKRTIPNPRDNPRPTSLNENASMITLASSNAAVPATPTLSQGPGLPLSPQSRQAYRLAGHNLGTPSVTWADPSDMASTFGEPSARSLAGDQQSNYALSHLTSSFGARRPSFDDDASDRAVRRRGSWESGESGWSWRGPARAPASSVGPGSIGGGRASLSISLRSRGYDNESRSGASPLVLGSVVPPVSNE